MSNVYVIIKFEQDRMVAGLPVGVPEVAECHTDKAYAETRLTALNAWYVRQGLTPGYTLHETPVFTG